MSPKRCGSYFKVWCAAKCHKWTSKRDAQSVDGSVDVDDDMTIMSFGVRRLSTQEDLATQRNELLQAVNDVEQMSQKRGWKELTGIFNRLSGIGAAIANKKEQKRP